MDAILRGVTEREIGGLPLSIGTSFAIESACGILQDRDEEGNPIPTPPKPAPIKNVKELWVNTRTLFRNLFGAIPKETKEVVLPKYLVMALQEEMQVIDATIQKIAGDAVKVVYYMCTYEGLPKKFPKAQIKEPTTDKQKVYWALEQNTCRLLTNSHPEIRRFNVDIEGNHPDAFILSHCVVDLLSRHSFRSLQLLESHTGKIKPHTQWSSKLSNGKELTNIPFNRMTLQVFGDGPVFFSPMPIKVRKAILDIATQYKWTAVTTKDKMIYGIKQMHDHFSRQFFLDLLLE